MKKQTREIMSACSMSCDVRLIVCVCLPESVRYMASSVDKTATPRTQCGLTAKWTQQLGQLAHQITLLRFKYIWAWNSLTMPQIGVKMYIIVYQRLWSEMTCTLYRSPSFNCIVTEMNLFNNWSLLVSQVSLSSRPPFCYLNLFSCNSVNCYDSAPNVWLNFVIVPR